MSFGTRFPDAVKPDLQGPSPDEVALVDGGRQLGFEFLTRTNQGVTLRMLGHEATFEVLNMMEFSSERGRMSVIARSPDGTIRLFAKGADSKMLSIVNKNTDPQLLEQTARNLHLFATQVSASHITFLGHELFVRLSSVTLQSAPLCS